MELELELELTSSAVLGTDPVSARNSTALFAVHGFRGLFVLGEVCLELVWRHRLGFGHEIAEVAVVRGCGCGERLLGFVDVVLIDQVRRAGHC